MSALWSRVARQSSCNCRLCHQPGVRIARRAATAASKRKVSGADIFTACYTTIFGTAAILDASRKESRRQALDRKIDEAKAALNPNAPSPPPSAADTPASQTDQISIPNPCETGPHPQSKRVHRKNRKPYTDFSLIQHLIPDCQLSPEYPPLPPIDWASLEDAGVYEERNVLRSREPRTGLHLDILTDNVAHMIHVLLAKSQGQQIGEKAPAGGPGPTKPEVDALRKLETIRASSHCPAYDYPEAQPSESIRVRQLLNQSIRSVFTHATSAKEAVAKICYNLLASSIPPSIHTYNALIAGFHRIQRPDLAQVVVDSYLHDTRINATQHTIVLILHHYRARDDREGFRDIIERMRANRGHGLGHSVPIESVLSLWPDQRQAQAMQRGRARNGQLIEMAELAPPVCNALVSGWLHFGNVAAAGRAFVRSLRPHTTRWAIDVRIMEHLFHACIARFDHATARKVASGMAERIIGFIDFLNHYLKQAPKAESHKFIALLYQFLTLAERTADHVSPWCESAERLIQALKSSLQVARLAVDLQESSWVCQQVSTQLFSAGPLEKRLNHAIGAVDRLLGDWGQTDAIRQASRTVAIDKRVQEATRQTTELCRLTEMEIVRSTLNLDRGAPYCPKALATRDGARDGLNWQAMYASLYEPLRQGYFKIRLCEASARERVHLHIIRSIPDRVISAQLERARVARHTSLRVLSSFWWSTARPRAKEPGPAYSPAVEELEEQIEASEAYIKALLFEKLTVRWQLELRHLWPNWHDTPLDRLVDLHDRHFERLRIMRDSAGQSPLLQARALEAMEARRAAEPRNPRWHPAPRMTAWQLDVLIKERRRQPPEAPATTARAHILAGLEQRAAGENRHEEIQPTEAPRHIDEAPQIAEAPRTQGAYHSKSLYLGDHPGVMSWASEGHGLQVGTSGLA